MPKVSLSIPKLGVTEKGWEKNKEIYVIGLAADLNQESKSDQDCVGACNETLPHITPAASELAVMKWVVVSVSNVFHWIRHDQPPSLSGSGIILYPNLDPKGLLALHLTIVESDQGKRDFGKVLGEILGHEDTENFVTQLSGGLSKSPIVGALMSTITSIIPSVLKNNKDDALLNHNHSGFDYDNYGLLPGSTWEDIEIKNDRAYGTLRVRIND